MALVSGLERVRDPWSDLVNWYQDMMLASAKYRTFAGAMNRFAEVRHRARLDEPPVAAAHSTSDEAC